MSTRLGSALAEYLRLHLSQGHGNFVLIEGVPAIVAEGMSRAWDDSLPTLAVVSAEPHRFGRYALTDISATQLRNQPGTTGVVLVLCDGEQVPDRQSLNLFQSVSPSISARERRRHGHPFSATASCGPRRPRPGRA